MKIFWRFVCLSVLLLLLHSMDSDCVIASHRDRVPPRIPARVPILHLTLSAALYPVIGPIPTNKRLTLSIGLALQNQAKLNQLLADQIDPTSSFYHHYLTPPQFAARFSPTQKTIDAITKYLRTQGFKINAIASNRLFISVTGSVAIAEKAFATKLQQYKYKNRVVYAPSVDPSVPNDIAASIQTIGGLDNVASYHPIYAQSPFLGSPTHAHILKGFTPTQLRSAYNMQKLIDAASSGPPQTIALVELDGYNPGDIDTYLKRYDLGPPKYSNVLVDGAQNSVGSGSSEVELDMEVTSALAPNAKQLVYIGPNSAVGINDLYNKIVSEDRAKITSISWGECEETTGNLELQALDNIFQQGSAQGQTFFAASGDSGAYDCGNGQLSVDSPADDPHVVGVGGTILKLGADNSYQSESAWGTVKGENHLGSGGGVSSFFPHPSYQPGTSVNRMVPDVSANADPDTGYSMYCLNKFGSCKGWSSIGGTSAAAPLWAAIAVNTNQYILAQGGQGIGNVNAALYTINRTQYPSIAYHDIITGNNLGYNAGPGYDMATGLGTPNAWNVARDLEVIYHQPKAETK